jgi:2-keto-4-pentenoate hydratase/2-oxohepta-3-ene-1,7-dioic acid hydratase in catechol pathway
MIKFSRTEQQRKFLLQVVQLDRLFYTSHSDQIFSVKQTIAFLSQGTTLQPGTIVLTGTPKGVGFFRKPPVYLKHGDAVQVWIGSGIGTLVNPVIEEGKPSLSTNL